MTQDNAPVPGTPWDPMIVTVAPNGARRVKADHPEIPLTADELAGTAAMCRDAGAAMIHLHVRKADGTHLLDADAYLDAMAAVRREVGEKIVVQITSESGGIYTAEEQMAVVEAVHPEAVSIAIKEIIPTPESEVPAAGFFERLAAENVAVQYILYSPQGVTRFQDLRRRGIIQANNPFVLFVLGRYSMGQMSVPDDLLPFLTVHDRSTSWALCAFGRWESACVLTAGALGGHVRVGFENNLALADGTTARSNADLVAQAADGAALIGRAVADASMARDIMNGGSGGSELRLAGGGG